MKVTSHSAEVMLMSWGQWMRGNVNLGYSRLSDGTGGGVIAMPWQVEITEQCVLRMPKRIQRAVKHRFIGNEPDHIASKKLKCTEGEFEAYILQAINLLVDYIIEN